MVVKLQNTLSIDLPKDVFFEYDYASQDGERPGILHLTGNLAALLELLEESVRIIKTQIPSEPI